MKYIEMLEFITNNSDILPWEIDSDGCAVINTNGVYCKINFEFAKDLESIEDALKEFSIAKSHMALKVASSSNKISKRDKLCIKLMLSTLCFRANKFGFDNLSDDLCKEMNISKQSVGIGFEGSQAIIDKVTVEKIKCEECELENKKYN